MLWNIGYIAEKLAEGFRNFTEYSSRIFNCLEDYFCLRL